MARDQELLKQSESSVYDKTSKFNHIFYWPLSQRCRVV